MKQEKNDAPMTASHPPIERGLEDIDASTDVLVDDSLLLALRYDQEREQSQLAVVDIFVSTVDTLKEPPLITANIVLSIFTVDYHVDNVSCYITDDGDAMLTFEALSETTEFSRKWVPFCKKYSIEPRAPEKYFNQKVDYLKDKVEPSFPKDRRAMKREYEEFKICVNTLVAKAQKVPEEGYIMQDGTPWSGNNTRDHPGMIQSTQFLKTEKGATHLTEKRGEEASPKFSQDL